ncbi:PLC-like phosphodiesterase [Geopyxis carbonaria]|nr:PLC-like phosphodiesterase [Geopyxis carbonaria]
MPNLTIRNLTNTPLKITHTSRFPTPQPPKPAPITPKNFTDVGNLTHNFTSLLSKTPLSNVISPRSPSSSQLAENSKAFESKDVDITVDAFTGKDTGIALKADDILRIEFEIPGTPKKFRIDLPTGKKLEPTVSPRGDVGDAKLSAVFHRGRSHLALVSSAALDSWMGKLPDNTPLAALSMPGTHNSPTCHVALPSVRCQAVSVTSQLNNGIRFLDVRVQPDGRNLTLVHGAFPISLSGSKPLGDLVKDCYDFLSKHPSETVIVSLKREGRGETNDEDFSKAIKSEIVDKNKDRWYTHPNLPDLKNSRGKCVLFRRFKIHGDLKKEHDNKGWGVNAEHWAYNTPNDTRGAICVQDFCEVLETENIEKKVTYVKEHLERSCLQTHPTPPANKLYVNFLSASNFWKVGCWPDRIAAKINPQVCEHLAITHKVEKGHASTGVVVLDFVGDDGNWSICKLVVGMNQGLLMSR